MDLTKYDFSYMRPPKEVFQVKHDPSYVLRGEGYKLIRKIFYKVEYSKFEKEKIAEFRELIKKEGVQIPENWTDADILKYALSGRFVLSKSIVVLKNYLQWRSNRNPNYLSQGALDLIKQGIVYISGRDRMYRPIITLNVYKIDVKNTKIEDFVDALVFTLDLGKNHCFVPYHVENWHIIVETNDMGFWSFPFDILKKVLEITTSNYQSTLEKLYLMNPSFIMATSWNIIKGWLDPDTASKISMLKKGEYHQLFEKIDPSQVEQKYGGTLPDPTVFWYYSRPPFTTVKDPYTDRDLAAELNLEKKPSRRTSTLSLSKRISLGGPLEEDSKMNSSSHTLYHDFETIHFHNPSDPNTLVLTEPKEEQEDQEHHKGTGYPARHLLEYYALSSGKTEKNHLQIVEEKYHEELEHNSSISPSARYRKFTNDTTIIVERERKSVICGFCRSSSEMGGDEDNEKDSGCNIF